MTQKERYKSILDWFEQNVPEPKTELHYNSTFELLVAVVLSAQCTDKRVNMITPSLFAKLPTASDMANASEDEIYQLIKSVSYPNAKAHNLHALANMLINDFGGEVPSDFDDLVKLPGVGRKTANVILSVVYNKSTMAVDTHVFRVSNRIGLTNNSKTPLATEQTLVKYIPEELIPKAHHWLILHGRYVCTARKPHCPDCGISQFCKEFNSSNKK